jgi:hypothetical protein
MRKEPNESRPLISKFLNVELIRKYGITLETYVLLFEKQKGRCAICGRSQKDFKRRLAVDHDHETGKIRGLLCVGCNNLVGHYEKLKDEVDYYLTKAKHCAIKPKFLQRIVVSLLIVID